MSSKPTTPRASSRGGPKRRDSAASSADSGPSQADKTNPELGPMIDSHSVLEHFEPHNAGSSPLASLLKEFASRMMMLFDVGADSGANFTDYWTMIVDVRGQSVAKELRGLGPLFRFVYQHIYATASQMETSRADHLKMNKADARRAATADSMSNALSSIQKSLDTLIAAARNGKTLHGKEARETVDGVLSKLEGVNDPERLASLGLSTTEVSRTVSKARDASMSCALNASPGRRSRESSADARNRGLPPTSPRAEPGQSKQPGPPGAAKSGAKTARRHGSPKRGGADGDGALSARQPHPSLPVMTEGSMIVRPHENKVDLPPRPFASPFSVPAMFDVSAFVAAAEDRRKHKEWLRNRVNREYALAAARAEAELPQLSHVPSQRPVPPSEAPNGGQPAATTSATSAPPAAGKPQPAPPAQREETELMNRLRAMRQEVLGPFEDVVVTDPKAKQKKKPPSQQQQQSQQPGKKKAPSKKKKASSSSHTIPPADEGAPPAERADTAAEDELIPAAGGDPAPGDDDHSPAIGGDGDAAPDDPEEHHHPLPQDDDPPREIPPADEEVPPAVTGDEDAEAVV